MDLKAGDKVLAYLKAGKMVGRKGPGMIAQMIVVEDDGLHLDCEVHGSNPGCLPDGSSGYPVEDYEILSVLPRGPVEWRYATFRDSDGSIITWARPVGRAQPEEVCLRCVNTYDDAGEVVTSAQVYAPLAWHPFVDADAIVAECQRRAAKWAAENPA